MRMLTATQSILGRSIPVLCYHQVRPNSGMTPDKFGTHLDLIQKMGFRTISLTQLYEVIAGINNLSFPAIVITFDDCTLDNWVYAIPELIQRNMTGVFFAITDFLRPGSARPQADQGVKSTIPAFEEIMHQALQGHCEWFMNFSEIQSSVHDLGMEVYAHSAAHQACFTNSKQIGILKEKKHWSHAHLYEQNSHASTPVFKVGSAYAHDGFGMDWNGTPLHIATKKERLAFCLEDFRRAKEQLETILSIPCPFLCLPWGQFDEVTLQASSLAGYRSALTLERTSSRPGSFSQCIGRIAVTDSKSLAWLRNKLLFHAHTLSAAFTSKRVENIRHDEYRIR